MRTIILYIFFGLLIIDASVYAENLTLKGSFYVGTKYVPASFRILDNDNIYYNIIFKKYGERELNIINNLINICNGNDGKKCEIVANVTKQQPDDIAYGDIVDIKYINGINSTVITNKKDKPFINKYNECLKSSKKLSEISEKSTQLMKRAESILSSNDMDQLRIDFRTSHSISENNPAEQMSKDRNISLCNAYVELGIDFIDMAESYINEKIAQYSEIKSNKVTKNLSNSDNNTLQYILDKNPLCPNIYGLYLGMNKDLAINILKSIANNNKLNLNLKENKNYLIFNLYSSRFKSNDDSGGTVISLNIYIGNEDIMR